MSLVPNGNCFQWELCAGQGGRRLSRSQVEAEQGKLDIQRRHGLDVVSNREPLAIHQKSDKREWCLKVVSSMGTQTTGKGCELLVVLLLGGAGQQRFTNSIKTKPHQRTQMIYFCISFQLLCAFLWLRSTPALKAWSWEVREATYVRGDQLFGHHQ